jgi:hypothetical protein
MSTRGLLTGRRLCDDVEVGGRAKQRRQACADEDLIIDDEYLDHVFG